MRDYEGYEQSRRKLVVSRPGLISNWVSFAGAAYVNRNYRGAIDCVESILKFEEEGTSKDNFSPQSITEVILLALRCREALG